MNSAEIIFPASLWAARDSAIAAFCSGTTDIPAEKKLEGWLLSDKAYMELSDGDNAFGMLCDLRYEDCEIREWLQLEAGETVGDLERIRFARERMRYIREYGTDAVHVDARVMKDNQGRQVIVGLSSAIMGQGEIDFKWLGLFESKDSMIKSIIKKGYAIESFLPGRKKFDHYTDTELLIIMSSSNM
jgi:hypothetical protein